MKYVKLKELCSIKHGYAFKGQYISLKESENILVTPGNFYIGGGFKEDKCKYYINDKDIPSNYVLKSGDLIVTMTDLSKEADTLGYAAYIPDNPEKKYLHNQRIGLIQNIKEQILDKDFLYWFLRTKKYHNEIVATSTGTTVHHSSPDKILNVKIPLFEIKIQKKIGSILNLIERKIKLNSHINNNLLVA